MNKIKKGFKEPVTISEKQISDKVFYSISFIEGASVMAIELIGAKMIAPFYGNSLYVWASVLGITLGGLASGYFTGGFLSKKFPKARTLFFVILLATLTVFIMPEWANVILKMTLNLNIIMATLVSCFFFLFPPLFFFGMTSPVIINILTNDAKTAGKISGNVYAVSTVGGILMTFLTGFYLIPELGIKTTTYIVAFVLFFIPLIYFVYIKRYIVPLLILGILGLLIARKTITSYKDIISKNIKVHYKTDGLLGQMLVVDEIKAMKRALYINNTSQSFMDIPTGRSQWKYVHRIALYSSYKPEGSKVLICGLGGGNLVNEFQRLGFEVDAVEIDERMEMVAKKYFFMNDDVNVIIDDARHFIKTCKKKYDIIVFDMTSGENQPFNLYTQECFNETKDIMKEDGIMFLHYQNVLQGEYALAAKSIGKTLKEAGLLCQLIETGFKWNEHSERMFFISKIPIDLTKQSYKRRDRFADPFNFPVKAHIFIAQYDFSDGMLLTDDKPIMDFLHLNTLATLRGGSIKQTIPVLLKEKIEILE